MRMRVAAFQRFAIFDAIGKAGDVVSRDLLRADELGIDLAVFPESYLQGHSYHRETIERLALSLDDPQILDLLDRLQPVETTAIVGFFERRNEAVYNSAMVIEAGRIKGVYAKANPLENGCTAGADFPVWSSGNLIWGINICADLRRPDIADRISSQGAGLICCPLNMMLRPEKAVEYREPCIASLQSCARQTKCWVVSSDVVGGNSDGKMSYRCSAVVSTDGTVVARAAELAEDVVGFDQP